jgi:enterochelin esterase-like enzyme
MLREMLVGCYKLVFLLMASGSFAQSQLVKIEVIPLETYNDSLYLAGEPAILGNWAPNGRMLQNEGKGMYHTTFEVDSGTAINFKVTRGSWATERVSAEGFPLVSTSVLINRDTSLRVKVEEWKDQKFRFRSDVVGNIDTLQPDFSGIDPRAVYPYRPPTLKEGMSPNFIVVHDGQNAFDPRLSTLGIEWLVDDFLFQLEQQQWIEPTLAVFISSSKDRNAEYSPGTKGTAYLSWIDQELIPSIEQKYQISIERENSAVMGVSMGGLVSMMCLLELPHRFSKAACLSSAFQIGPYDYLPKVQSWTPKGDEQIILYNGGNGLEALLQSGNDALMQALDQKGFAYSWIHNKKASHDELAWSRQTPFILLEFFGK